MSRLAGRGREINLVDALNAEWIRLADEDDSVRRWVVAHPALTGCGNLHDVLARVRGNPDGIFMALLDECANGDDLAGRVVLQAMLGKIVTMAVRDRCAGVDDYVASMWSQIKTYPLRSRPQRIAANLALDTLKAVTAETRFMRGGEVTPYPPDTFLEAMFDRYWSQQALDHNSDVAHLDARRVLSAAGRLGLIDAKAQALLTTVYADEVGGQAAAELHHKSRGAVRFQCSSAIRQLARHAALLADAA